MEKELAEKLTAALTAAFGSFDKTDLTIGSVFTTFVGQTVYCRLAGLDLVARVPYSRYEQASVALFDDDEEA